MLGGQYMELSELAVGMEVSVCATIGDQTLSFPSQIKGIADNKILIDPITHNNKPVGFKNPAQVAFLVNDNSKIFRFAVTSIVLVKSRGNIYHMLELSGMGTAYNRRKNYRLYIGEEMRVTIFGANGPELITALVKDVSEGGFCIITSKDIDPKFHLRLHFQDQKFATDLPANIVRKIPGNRPGEFLYGCSLRIKSDSLSKYIMRSQIERTNRKKT